MQSLYKVSQGYRDIVDQIVQNGGEITPELNEELIESQGNLEAVAMDFALVLRELSGDIDTIDSEIERLTKIKIQMANSHNSIKKQIQKAMEFREISKIKGPLISLSLRPSEETIIENEALIPEFFKDKKITYTVNKKEIKDTIKSGITVPGAYILEKKNLIIK